MCQCSTDSEPKSTFDLNRVWRPDDGQTPAPLKPGSGAIYREDIFETIREKIKELDPELRELSLDIHGEQLYRFRSHRTNSCQYQLTPSLVTKNSTYIYRFD